MCKLSKLVIKEFDGSVLDWQTFWDQLEPTAHSKANISNIDKCSKLSFFFFFVNLLKMQFLVWHQ